jgi:hypothetical protein
MSGPEEETEVDVQRREVLIEHNLGLERPPGSRNGLIFTAIVLSLMGASFDGRIWVNNWESVRLALGTRPSTNIVGAWGVVNAQELDESGSSQKDDGLYGTIQFASNGAVRLSLSRGVQTMEATGLYTQSGDDIVLRQLSGTNGASPLPDQLVLKLDYRKGNAMQVDISDQERLSLQLIDPNSSQ